MTFLPELRREMGAFRACLDGDVAAPVEHCPGWTLRELTQHLGGVFQWAAVAVTERRGDFKPSEAPRDGLARWFEESSATVMDALGADPASEAWTFSPPGTVGFWRRRLCLETLVHRWDAENALGAAHPLDPALAAEGVAEVFDTVAPRQVKRGSAQPPRHAVRFRAADAGRTWEYGPGSPAAEITATAENLLLMLWKRLPADHEAITWQGDRDAARAVLAEPLTP